MVAAATGPVGATVGQIAKLKGCRTVGIAGGSEKCRYAVETLGFDACIDHRAPDFAVKLLEACPQGIDIYYENVGGKVFDEVLPLLMATILKKRIRMQGFIIGQDYGHRIAEFQQEMGRWVQAGKIKYREQVVDGLENAPQALIGLLKGENFGKVVVRVSPDE